MTQAKNFQFNFSHFRKQFRHSSLPAGDLICAIGGYFLGAPYETGILETGRKERLIVNFEKFDCFTFVETLLILTRCFTGNKISAREFRRQLQFIRYRKGIIDGYSSRLHYFTDWLTDNEKKKILKDVSRFSAGEPQCKKINFMTVHRTSYPALKSEEEFQKMLSAEKNLSRKVFHIIGRDEVSRQKAKIKNGDIIAFAADQDGLDVAHVGFAFRRRGNLYLLHASSKEGAVVISKTTLVAYLKSNKKISGILVARIL